MVPAGLAVLVYSCAGCRYLAPYLQHATNSVPPVVIDPTQPDEPAGAWVLGDKRDRAGEVGSGPGAPRHLACDKKLGPPYNATSDYFITDLVNAQGGCVVIAQNGPDITYKLHSVTGASGLVYVPVEWCMPGYADPGHKIEGNMFGPIRVQGTLRVMWAAVSKGVGAPD